MKELQEMIRFLKKLKLLYVEDNKETRESTLLILEDFFNKIEVANDGKEGLEIFRTFEIDLIITDINMPCLDGLNMIKEIRKLDKDIPALILSSYNELTFFKESINVGVDGYLLKPIDVTQFIHMLQKITEKLKLKEEVEKNISLLNQYKEATDKSSIVSKSDLKGKIIYVNDAFCDISEYSREELIGQSHSIIRHPDNSSLLYKDLWETIQLKKTIWQGVIRNKSKNGNSYYVNTTIKPILDQNDEIIEYISLRNDITGIMSSKKQLQDIAESYEETVIVLIKIEGFDDIEKSYGSKLSEKIEKDFSKEILRFIPKECGFKKVFSLAEGEYAFAKNKASWEFSMNSVIANMKNLQERLNDSKIKVDEIEYDISIIISLAYGKNALENAGHGLKQLLETKQDFIIANNLVEYERDASKKSLEILKMVKRAIDDFKIVSYFQPIINNKTKKVEKYESLVRLVDINGNIISPFLFLDTAKKGKYYSQITAMVLANSFSALKHTDMDITINISVLDIEKKLTRKKIFEHLNDNIEYLHRVVFELLEDEEVKDFELIRSFINEVKSMGVKIAIDDFGAGYSNFERLLDYQPDIVKIDGSLIKNIENDEFSLNVVETIVRFAKKQKIKIVAEYVENENIFNILNKIGVDYSQGYYFGRPEELKVVYE